MKIAKQRERERGISNILEKREGRLHKRYSRFKEKQCSGISIDQLDGRSDILDTSLDNGDI